MTFLERNLEEFDKEFYADLLQIEGKIEYICNDEIKDFLTQYHNNLIQEIVQKGEEMKMELYNGPVHDQAKLCRGIGIIEGNNKAITNYQEVIKSL